MNNKKILTGVIGTALALSPLMAFAEDGSATVNVDASVNTSATVGSGSTHTTLEARQENHAQAQADHQVKVEGMAHDRADKELDRRITALNSQKSRVNDMKRVSDADQASISASIDAQISALTQLKAKIAADTDAATLKADFESITKSYRIYMVVLPKGAITAASDRVKTVVGQMQTLSAKLATRIAAAPGDTSALVSARADMDAKVADADVQAKAALALVVNLQPDNGDAAVQAANKTAMTNAKAKIQAAQADLKAARADITTIVKGLGGKKEVKADVSGSVTH